MADIDNVCGRYRAYCGRYGLWPISSFPDCSVFTDFYCRTQQLILMAVTAQYSRHLYFIFHFTWKKLTKIFHYKFHVRVLVQHNWTLQAGNSHLSRASRVQISWLMGHAHGSSVTTHDHSLADLPTIPYQTKCACSETIITCHLSGVNLSDNATGFGESDFLWNAILRRLNCWRTFYVDFFYWTAEKPSKKFLFPVYSTRSRRSGFTSAGRCLYARI